MDTRRISAGHAISARSQEITMEPVNVRPGSPRPRNAELEQRVRDLVGEGDGSRATAHRTTVHGTAPRANHR
jgi:hypothetical protein